MFSISSVVQPQAPAKTIIQVWLVHISNGFSVASILTLPFWIGRYLSYGAPTDSVFLPNSYHFPSVHALDDLAGLAFLLLLTVTLATLDRALAWARGIERYVRDIGALLLVLLIFNFFRTTIFLYPSLDDVLRWFTYGLVSATIAIVLSLVVLVAFIKCYGFFFVAARGFVRTGAFVGIVIVANALIAASKLGFPMVITGPGLSEPREMDGIRSSSVRVVWMIFDGLDQRLTFVDRDASVEFAGFDTMRSTSFYAANARSPGIGTLISIPGLMTGNPVEKFRRLQDDLLIQYVGAEDFISWRGQETVISDVRSLGLKTAVFTHSLHGHPYCRLFGSRIDACWEEGGWYGTRINSLDRFKSIARSILRVIPFIASSVSEASLEPYYDRDAYLLLRETASNAVTSERFGFVYVHWMLPHPMSFYDRLKDDFLPHRVFPERYPDNLELASHTLKHIFWALDASDVGKRTAVIVTADHGHGNTPVFMLRLPNETEEFIYNEEFNTVTTRKLISKIFDGTISSYKDVDAFFSH